MIRCRAPFEGDAELAMLAAGFLDHSFPERMWTHDAHWAVSVDLALHHPGFELSRDLPDAIRRFNVASGLQNTDTSGYHETITRASIAMVETRHCQGRPGGAGFRDRQYHHGIAPWQVRMVVRALVKGHPDVPASAPNVGGAGPEAVAGPCMTIRIALWLREHRVRSR